jgi:hypothetical protein
VRELGRGGKTRWNWVEAIESHQRWWLAVVVRCVALLIGIIGIARVNRR